MPEPPSRQSLDDILAEFDRTHEKRPITDESADRERQDAWLAAFDAQREQVVRIELEEVAWQVEQKGHHAWLDDVPGTRGCSGIELKVLPAADARSAAQAPGLRFRPDPGRERVVTEVHSLTLADEVPHTIALLTLDQLDGPATRDLGTRLVDAVFLHHERVLDTQELSDEDDWVPEEGGIAPTRGQSADWS